MQVTVCLKLICSLVRDEMGKLRDLTNQLKVLLILSHEHQQMEFTQLSSLHTDFVFFIVNIKTCPLKCLEPKQKHLYISCFLSIVISENYIDL